MKKIISVFLISLMFLTGCSNSSTIEEANLEDIVTFNDSNLENLIRMELGIESGDVLGEDMQELYSLSFNGNNELEKISDLTGLEYATNLESISILYNDIVSLDPLNNLENLTYINVSYGSIENKICLKNPNLLRFGLTDITIDNIEFLEDLDTLINLTLSRCSITDISALENLSELESINLSDNSISNIEALSNKVNLTSLNLQNNEVVDVSSLNTNDSLETIILSYNHIEDLSSIMNFENLYELRIYEELDAKIASRSQINELVTKGVEVYYHE